MEFRFYCPSCGQKLKAGEEHAGRTVDCPHCGVEFLVPQPEPELPPSPAEPTRDRAFANPNLDGALTCPVCWLRFDTGDIMHRAVHDHAPEIPIHGVEKTDETGRLCSLNLTVHGLEGDIRHGGNVNSYYDDPHDATGRFDFVLANPPFNVNDVDTAMRVSARRQPEGSPQDLPARQDHERLNDMVGMGRRFPFGLPRTDNATATRARAKAKLAKPDRRSVGESGLHYLWLQLFHSALNEKGSAGFVMANGARSGHSCSMKFTEAVRKYAAEQGIAEEDGLKKGMEAKSKEFVEKGAEVYAKA